MKHTTLLLLAVFLLAATLTPVFAETDAEGCTGDECCPPRPLPPLPEEDAEVSEDDCEKTDECCPTDCPDQDHDGLCDECGAVVTDSVCPNCTEKSLD